MLSAFPFRMYLFAVMVVTSNLVNQFENVLVVPDKGLLCELDLGILTGLPFKKRTFDLEKC